MNRLITSAYRLLNLQTFLLPTSGSTRLTLKRDEAPQCAGLIHTDFERGFIRAEVIKYDDFIMYGTEHAVKEAGKMAFDGKEYIVKDGDIIYFRFNV